MLNGQRIAACEYEMSLIDEALKALAHEDDDRAVDILLERRYEEMEKIRLFRMGLVPNG